MSKLLDTILTLSRDERYFIAERILESLKKEERADESGLTVDQLKVIEERLAEIEDGNAEFVSWREIKERIKVRDK